MKLNLLNGATLNGGFDRVYPGDELIDGYDDLSMEGFDRVTYSNPAADVDYDDDMQGLALNGLELNNMNYLQTNGGDFDDYLDYLYLSERGEDVGNMEGFFSRWKEKRQEKKAVRQERRTTRKDTRASKKEARAAKKWAKVENIKAGGGFLQQAGGIVSSIFGSGGDPEEIGMALDQGLDLYEEEVGDERGIFGPPSLFKKPGKWFASNKVPVIQKIGVVALAAIVADKALNKGKMLKKLTK